MRRVHDDMGLEMWTAPAGTGDLLHRVPPGGSGGGAERLARAARGVVEELAIEWDISGQQRLQTLRSRLSESLGCSLSPGSFTKVVAEVVALAWLEQDAATEHLPPPFQPVEELVERPGSPELEGALDALRSTAAQVRAQVEPGEDLYEGFLTHLDPLTRARNSVYLTPAPLVRMMVRSVDELLEDHLDHPAGLADPEVGLLDPAAGTGAFLLEAIETRERRRASFRTSALWQGFEVQPGAYVAATVRLDRWRREHPEIPPRMPRLHLGDLLDEDSPLASRTSSPWGQPVPSTLVVVGNPPWSDTAISDPWVDRLLRDGYTRPDGSRDDGYYRSGGDRVPSRNTKWLQSRYVKFLRVAQWCVDRIGRGVVALVVSDGLLDNLTMSGVRESLLGSFDALYLLDLGGSARKVSARGPDESLFRIQQGACVVILVKGGSGRGVRAFELRGRRAEKLNWLETHSVRATPWRAIEPTGPTHSLRPRRSVSVITLIDGLRAVVDQVRRGSGVSAPRRS